MYKESTRLVHVCAYVIVMLKAKTVNTY